VHLRGSTYPSLALCTASNAWLAVPGSTWHQPGRLLPVLRYWAAPGTVGAPTVPVGPRTRWLPKKGALWYLLQVLQVQGALYLVALLAMGSAVLLAWHHSARPAKQYPL